ncbi:hypothetical protein JCM9534A_35920 [Catenuloplanes indicus JCM 9534]
MNHPRIRRHRGKPVTADAILRWQQTRAWMSMWWWLAVEKVLPPAVSRRVGPAATVRREYLTLLRAAQQAGVRTGGGHVVVVDLDDTLIHDVPAARLAVSFTLAGLGLPADAMSTSIVLEHAQRAWSAHPHRRTGALTYVSSWEALWLPATAGLLEPVAASLSGHDERVWSVALTALRADARLAPEAAASFRRIRAGLLRPLPGVREFLDTLRGAGHVVWLATNGLAAHQYRKIDAAGLRGYFDAIFVSEVVGAPKSDPGFAAALTAALDATRRRVCMVVGDSAVHDLGLAAHGGWPAVHLCTATPCPDRSGAGEVVHTSTLDLALDYCRCPDPAVALAPGERGTTR